MLNKRCPSESSRTLSGSHKRRRILNGETVKKKRCLNNVSSINSKLFSGEVRSATASVVRSAFEATNWQFRNCSTQFLASYFAPLTRES